MHSAFKKQIETDAQVSTAASLRDVVRDLADVKACLEDRGQIAMRLDRIEALLREIRVGSPPNMKGGR